MADTKKVTDRKSKDFFEEGGFLKRELDASPIRKLGKVLAGNALLALKTKLDPDAYGGAPLLGLNGTVIKAHGSANARAIKNAIRVAKQAVEGKMLDAIRSAVG